VKLEIIEINKIDLGDRARKDYKDLLTLSRSIKNEGLICPIAVCSHPSAEESYLLCAGGRRLAACRLLKKETIACRIYDHVLSDLEIRCIELQENLHREDLEFDEQCFLQREILRLQEEIHGKKTSTSPNAKGVSIRDVAEMLNISHAKLAEDVRLANTMEALPSLDWKKCKNRSEALKLRKSMGDIMVRKELSEKAEKALGRKSALAQKLASSFIIGDFFEKSEELPNGYFDLVEIDSPYSINLGSQKKVDASLGIKPYQYGEGGYNEIKQSDYEVFMNKVFKTCYKKMSSNSWLICWFGPDPWFESIYQWIIDAGFKTRRLTAKWVKGEDENKDGYVEKTSGQTNNPSMYLANACEEFFYAAKGNPTLASPGKTNIFGHRPVPPGKKIHPTERPLELMSDILTTFTKENSKILVPFAGSGNTLIAAASCKMIPIGFDLTESYKEGYVIRINELFS